MNTATEDRADALFHALSDRTRRDIQRRVLAGEHSISELAARYDMSFAAVHKHVSVLERAGLLVKRRRGRLQLASGDIESVRSVGELLDEFESIWRGRIDRIDALLAADADSAADGPVERSKRALSTGGADVPVVDVVKDLARRTLTITAEFAAPIKRVWAIYADPRQLEKIWGPPGMPATFVEHDLRPGGRCRYYMTGPHGERYGGWWLVTDVDEPHGLRFDDGFDEAELARDPDLPVSHHDYAFTSVPGGTRAVYTIAFDSAADLAKTVDTGTDAGMRAAIGQIDGLLAAR